MGRRSLFGGAGKLGERGLINSGTKWGAIYGT